MSLRGKRVVVTRAPHQAHKLVNKLNAYGAIPVLYPCIAIAPTDDNTLVNALTEDYDWTILTSGNTVHALALCSADVARFGKIAVVGKSTARSLKRHFGVEADVIPATQTADALAQTLTLDAGARVFLPQSVLADDTLYTALSAQGATVTHVDAYRTVIAEGGDDLPGMLARGEIDALTFTSPSTADHLTTRLGFVPVDVPAACIGPVTADAVEKHGYTTLITPETYTLDAMLQALAGYWA